MNLGSGLSVVYVVVAVVVFVACGWTHVYRVLRQNRSVWEGYFIEDMLFYAVISAGWPLLSLVAVFFGAVWLLVVCPPKLALALARFVSEG